MIVSQRQVAGGCLADRSASLTGGYLAESMRYQVLLATLADQLART